MGKSDAAAAQVRERVWVDKMDKTTDPPTVVETVFMERHRPLEGSDEQGQAEEGAAEAADVQGHDGRQVRPDPYRTLSVIVRASQDCGIELERALRFVGILAAELKVPHLSPQPTRPQ